MENKYFKIGVMLCFCFGISLQSSAQILTEIEGTTKIKMNSTSGEPHLLLEEDDTSPGGSARIEFRHVNDAVNKWENRAFLGYTDTDYITWRYNNTNKFSYRMGPDEGFGIGTTSPSAMFDVIGNGEFTHNSTSTDPTLALYETGVDDYTRLFFYNVNSADRWALSSRVGTSVDNSFGFYYNGGARMVYNEENDGLGIGLTNPTQKLHVYGTGNNGVRIEGDGSGDTRVAIANTGGTHYIFDDASQDNDLKIQSANELAFLTNGVNERMRIASTGGEVGINGGLNVNRRFGIQTDNDLYALYSDQNGNGTAYGAYITTESNGASSKYGVYGAIGTSNGTGNSYAIRGVASTSQSGWYGMYCQGDFWYTGSLTAPSDIKLKKNLKALTPVLDKLMQLEPKTYEYKTKSYDFMNLAQGTQMGFVAQEVQAIFPELVEEESHSFETEIDERTGEPTETKVSILGLSSIEMIPILTKAIQEQQVLINKMAAEIEALKAKQ